MAYFVDRVVVCDGYREPDRHYKLLAGGKSKLVPDRRPSMRFLSSAKAVKGGLAGLAGKQTTLLEDLVGVEEQLNETVNELRSEVAAWRDGGYGDTALVTGRLLEWWFERDEERQKEGRRFFFAQREAVETTIYLYEVQKRQQMPETGELLRYALKLATGTGKTVVMALLVTWSALHSRKVAGSTLSENFLVLVPNLTVRDRVRGIDERTGALTGAGLDPTSAESIYTQWDTVPPEYTGDFRPNVLVRNWQSIPVEARRDDWLQDAPIAEGRFVPASVLAALQRRRKAADPTAPIRKLLHGWRDIVVINDEAHHVYGERRTRAGEDPAYIRWSKIIDTVAKAVGISLVVDLSATPWYGSGSPKPDGTLFEWLISDFSVYDAFESGLVKAVRLPDPEEGGNAYLNLWDLVKDAKTKEEYLSACKGAIATIYGSWREDYLDWEKQLEGIRSEPPPVLLVVADRAQSAAWLFEHLTRDYELLRNPDDDDRRSWLTIQIDSKVFEAEKGQQAVLREMVNTVGQAGRPGELVRCIVSVDMLAEGWDVKNVSHILGLRAFGSPLLTEQVIGRGLRRVDYTVLNVPIEERLADEARPDEETVDAFGVPFIGFPVEKRKRARTGSWGAKPTPIAPDPSKAKYAMEIPNVRSWAVGVSKPLVEIIDVDELEETIIDPSQTPPEVTVKPVVGGKPEVVLTLQEFRREYPLSRSKLMLARDLYESLSTPDQDELVTGPTFEELLDLASRYIDQRVRAKGASVKEDIGIYHWMLRARNFLETAVRDAPSDAVTVPIPGEPSVFRTGDVAQFKWTGVLADGKKTHWTKVPCHTDLEASFSVFLDGARDVKRYVKNERIGYSITYYENGRPRQYFPDFVVAAEIDGHPMTWVIETKGEMRPNTLLKKEAADLWCDRMRRAGRGDWRHLFLRQVVFEQATREQIATLAALIAFVEERELAETELARRYLGTPPSRKPKSPARGGDRASEYEETAAET